MIRFRIELVLASTFLLLTVVTAVWPTWIEGIFEVSPDAGSGQSEWLISAVFGLLALTAAVLARRDYIVSRRVIQEGDSATG
jgi:hypothetical protein